MTLTFSERGNVDLCYVLRCDGAFVGVVTDRDWAERICAAVNGGAE